MFLRRRQRALCAWNSRGDEIDTLSYFDPETQRRTEDAEHLVIGPLSRGPCVGTRETGGKNREHRFLSERKECREGQNDSSGGGRQTA